MKQHRCWWPNIFAPYCSDGKKIYNIDVMFYVNPLHFYLRSVFLKGKFITSDPRRTLFKSQNSVDRESTLF